jgi:anti-sigma-K factor RskA
MNLSGRYEEDDLALFAMQLLSKEETAAIAARLAGSATYRQQLGELQGDLAIYAHTAEMHSPPALTRERLMKQVAREKKVVPVEHVPPPPPMSAPPEYATRGLGSGRYLDEEEKPQSKGNIATRAFPWIGWAVAAGLAVATGSLYHEREMLRSSVTAQAAQIDKLSANAEAAKQLVDGITDTAAEQVTLTKSSSPQETKEHQPQGHVTYLPEKGTLIFMATDIEPLQMYKVYELWLIPADGRDPIPAGTFHPDERGNASVIMPPLPKGIEAKAFGVTIEDDGGSQTPTMPVVMAGN